MLFHNLWQTEINAEYQRRRVADLVASSRPLASGTRPPASRSRGGRLFVALGRGLIAVGERLAGPQRPASARSTVGRPV